MPGTLWPAAEKKEVGKMKAADIPGIASMTIPEKILLVDDLWEDIHASEDEVPVPIEHKNELDRRFQNTKQTPVPFYPSINSRKK
jgi:putative addiction module component (TIGR02574 family)